VSALGLSNNSKWRWWIRFTGCRYRRACGSSVGIVQRMAVTWRRFCIHRVNRVNSRSGSAMMTAL